MVQLMSLDHKRVLHMMTSLPLMLVPNGLLRPLPSIWAAIAKTRLEQAQQAAWAMLSCNI